MSFKRSMDKHDVDAVGVGSKQARRPRLQGSFETDGSEDTLLGDAQTLSPGYVNRAVEFATQLDEPRTSTSADAVDVALAPLEDQGFVARYDVHELIGKGGMGEVRLCKDFRVGREVAIKAMHERSDEALVRFVREARVQGQLEHPAIVPVYDLGMRPDGMPYFTMKRLEGLTLEEVLTGHSRGDEAVIAAHSMRKLLGDFVSICQAMEYVHSRGVVHRDLKPGNIMLGEFGEVHVIDWGVAKIADAPEPIQASSPRITMDSANLESKATAAGAIIGTLGYMPPEQLQGMHELVDGRSDIYSLGAILFEILTLEPLHSRNSPVTTAASTLTGANARARQRAPNRDIAPELEDICIKASQLDQDARYTGVREMIDELSRYLDGDRDLARRKALASEHGQNARELAREALEGTGKSSDAARKQALREAGRALALDPTQEEAVDILTQLMLEPPRHMPLEVEASLKATQQQENRQKMELAVYTYLLLFGFFPLLVWMGVTRPSIIWAQAGVLAVMTGVSYAVMRSKEIKPWMIFVGMMFNVAFVLVLTRIFSLFIVAPGFMAVNTVAFLFHKNLQKPLITVFMGCLGLTLPFIFELTGVFEPTLLFEDGRLIVLSHAIDLPRLPTLVTLELTSLALVVGAAVFMHRMWRAQYEIERQVHLQVWQLRQLVPDRAHRRVATAQPDIRKA